MRLQDLGVMHPARGGPACLSSESFVCPFNSRVFWQLLFLIDKWLNSCPLLFLQIVYPKNCAGEALLKMLGRRNFITHMIKFLLLTSFSELFRYFLANVKG